jgi:hypothetical protein
MSQPAADDPVASMEPTDEEIARAAADETRDATAQTRALRAAGKTTAPRRGPGRPKGAKTRPKTERDARAAGAASKVTTSKPRNISGAAANAHRDAEKRKREDRAQLVEFYTAEALTRRPQIVKAIGLATGIPAQFLVEHDDEGKPRKNEVGVEILTHYGEALAPQPWQVKTVTEGGVRLIDSEAGEKFVELVEKLGPYIYGTAACGALALYTVTTLQAVKAIRPMIEIELRQLAEAQAAAAAQAAGEQNTGTADGGPGLG